MLLCLPANARAVRISSAKATRKMPKPPARGPDIVERRGRQRRAGQASRDRADGRDAVAREVEQPGERDAATTTISAPGTIGRKRRRVSIAPSETTLTAKRGAAHVAELAHDIPEPSQRSGASTSSPSSLPSWAITSMTATPCK